MVDGVITNKKEVNKKENKRKEEKKNNEILGFSRAIIRCKYHILKRWY